MSIKALLVSLVLLIAAGCAMTTAIPVGPDDRFTWGFPVYGNKPVLFVTKAGWQVHFLPNYSKEYRVNFLAFLAKNKSKATIENGMITGELDVDLDSTAIIPLLQDIAKQALPSIGGQGGNIVDTAELVGIYDFRFDERGNYTHLHKLSPDSPDFVHPRRRYGMK